MTYFHETNFRFKYEIEFGFKSWEANWINIICLNINKYCRDNTFCLFANHFELKINWLWLMDLNQFQSVQKVLRKETEDRR